MFKDTLITANQIYKYFQETNWVILTAPMQSGKTSCYVAVADMMLKHREIDNVFVISGISNNELKCQTYDRVQVVGAKVLFQKDLEMKMRRIESGVISVDIIHEFSGSLIIIDESHIGANVDSVLHRFLSAIGIGSDGRLDPIYDKGVRKPYILSVSATAYAECAASTIGNKKIVYHKPGDGYVGLDQLNLIQIDTSDPKTQLLNALSSLTGTRTYAILRHKADREGSETEYIRQVANEMSGVFVIRCDQSNINDLTDLVSRRPDRFTIVLIKNYAKAGQTFSKRYVSMVWETYNDTDAQAQGLPGRCCGYETAVDSDGTTYNTGSRVQVYCYKDMLRRHISWNKELAMDPAAGSSREHIPTSGHNVKPATRARTRMRVDPTKQRFGVFSTIEEVKQHYKDFGYLRCPDFSVTKGGKTYKENEMLDENGCVRQYLPVTDNDVRVWSVDFIQSYLRDQYPCLNAKETTSMDDRPWKKGKVAKIAYLDPSDADTKRYVLYAYEGPVWMESTAESEEAMATDKSMYVHKLDPLCISGVVTSVAIPDDATDEQAIGLATSVIYGNKSCMFYRYSERDHPNWVKVHKKLEDLTIENLGWFYYSSKSLKHCLDPLAKARMETEIKPYVPCNQKDCAEYLVRTLARGIDNSKTGAELDVSPLTKKMWNYKVLLSKYLSANSNKMNISKQRKNCNYYYV